MPDKSSQFFQYFNQFHLEHLTKILSLQPIKKQPVLLQPVKKV